MFALRSITPLDIAQWGICLNNSGADEVVQTKEVLVVSETVEVASAEGQGAKVLCDGGEKSLCRRDTEGDFGGVTALGVVGCLHL